MAVFASKEAAEARVKELQDLGWTSLPIDNPEEARRGFIIFHSVACDSEDGAQDESETVEWDLFDQPLQRDVVEVSAETLVEMLKADPVAYKCDYPMELKMGFVWYRLEQGIAATRRVSLKAFKAASEEDRKFILNCRTSAPL